VAHFLSIVTGKWSHLADAAVRNTVRESGASVYSKAGEAIEKLRSTGAIFVGSARLFSAFRSGLDRTNALPLLPTERAGS
jgi:hypothetical protein